MKHSLKAKLFGTPEFFIDGVPANIRLKRAQALLIFLLVEKKTTREEITALIWPEENQDLARRHLRDILYTIRRSTSIQLIVSDGKTKLMLNPGLDIETDVDALIDGGELQMQDEFAKNFYLKDSAEYEA